MYPMRPIIIIGLIGWNHGHYVSYVKSNYTWEIHNDLQRKIQKFTSKTKNNPYLIMYIKV